MRILVLAAACVLASAAAAEDAVPDLVGTWVGTAKSVVFGQTRFHPGEDAATDAPRVRELEWTMEITGQDGRVLWGKAWSAADPTVVDTLALALAADGKTIIGAGDDGSHYMTLAAPDR